ncbi:hypothetical protein P153DRAFT_377359 [Dothidotthia symphoricarpi CBS 119687]|uniref:Cell wall anchored protein n=1 Tax=Dothidotthia symphoricarpi CBS 119687 TaxID=1392245 RepID=A0A6A6A4Y4_9PLEO|nr:uncharacterized protein P153DRAFT_377359 [Dothidotthia symphoricarpi CBS 119687]KAF2127052.1 hypothetical protein P153DRAFT_377359 [Dothidotthia symphoricarpi CBS 119687]
MAYFRLCLLVAFSLVARAQQKDPVQDFCRRWGHQTAQIDGRLFIDGGMVDWDPAGLNYTNTWLVFSDLNSTTQVPGMPAQYANLSKPAHIPSVSGGLLWADNVNKCFYQFGGEYPPGGSPTDFSLWTYDVLLNQWNSSEYTSDPGSFQRVSFGAGTEIESLGLGYHYGGWLNERTTPGWTGHPIATSNLIRFEFSTGTMRNNSGPDTIGRAEGQLVYLPASDGGLLVYFGGIEDPSRNGTTVADIHILDIASSKWYFQTAAGDTPLPRRQFCADVTWADDKSSYNIYSYGGYGFGNSLAFDDVYILSLPSFTWIKSYNGTGQYAHGGCSANVINHNQMLVIGGWFPSFDQCDSPDAQGQHNMNLGYNGGASTIWDRFDPKLSQYSVPTPIIAAIGGGPTGGATVTAPATWGDNDLRVYFTRTASFATRAATRLIPTNTSGSSSDSKHSNVGAIAGGVVGGLVALITILCLILFCFHRRKKAMKKDNVIPVAPSSPPPAELAATISRQELPAPGTGKYLSMNQYSDSNAYSNYSGGTSQASQSPGYSHHSPPSLHALQPYASTSPTSTRSHPAETAQQAYQPLNTYPPYSDNRMSYDNQSPPRDNHTYPPPSAIALQHQYPYPAPGSPAMPPLYQPQQQPQMYFPPPPESAYHSHRPQHSVDYLSNPDATRYSNDVEHRPLSTTNTPAQFYAQPVSNRPPPMPESTQRSPTLYEDEDMVNGSDGAFHHSPVSERARPARGRFVEVDHM